MSTYLTAPLLVSGKARDFFSRLQRLYVPFVLWALIAFVLFSCFSDLNWSMCKLFWQLLTGHSYYQPLYYIVDLVFIAIVLFVVCRLCFNVVILCVIGILIPLGMQYSGLNYSIFGSLGEELRYTTGRFLELLPYGAVGLLYWRYRSITFIQRIPIWLCVMMFVVSFMLRNSFFDIPVAGFSYQGAWLFLEATFLSIGFIRVGECFQNKFLWTEILGDVAIVVYFVHCLVGKAINGIVPISSLYIRGIVVFCCSVLVALIILKIHVLKNILVKGKLY